MSYGYLEVPPTGNSCCRYETGFRFPRTRISVESLGSSLSPSPSFPRRVSYLSSFVYVLLTGKDARLGGRGRTLALDRAVNCGINSRKDEYACQGGTKRVSLSRTGFPTWSDKSCVPAYIVEHVPDFSSSFGRRTCVPVR